MPIRSFRRNNRSNRKPSLLGRLTSWRRTYYSETDIPLSNVTSPASEEIKNPVPEGGAPDGFFSRYEVNVSEIRSLPVDLSFEQRIMDQVDEDDDEEEVIVKIPDFDEIAGRKRDPSRSSKAVHWAPENREAMNQLIEKKNLSKARKPKTDSLLRKTAIHVSSTVPDTTDAEPIDTVEEEQREVDEIPKISNVSEATPVSTQKQASSLKMEEATATPTPEPEKSLSIDLNSVLEFVTNLFAIPLQNIGRGTGSAETPTPMSLARYDAAELMNDDLLWSRQSSYASSWNTDTRHPFQNASEVTVIAEPPREEEEDDDDDLTDSPQHKEVSESVPALCDVSSSSNEAPSVDEGEVQKPKVFPERWNIENARQVSMNESLSTIDSDEQSIEEVLNRARKKCLQPKKRFANNIDFVDDETVEDVGCMTRWERKAKRYHRSGCKDVSPLDEITQALADCSYFLRCGARGVKQTAFSAVAMPNFNDDAEKEDDESGTDTVDDSSIEPTNAVPFIIQSTSPSRQRNNSL